jgi:predicted RNA-binding Zn ribbon-like protein
MELTALVALVNKWGTLPREVEGRDAPPGEDRSPVADRLYAVFAATSREDRAATVNTLLAETGVRPEVGGWRVPRASDTLLASAALALREHLQTHPDRIGVCHDDQCADVYVDSSPAGHRRFCSVTCQNRTRVAAFRARRKAGA